MVITLKITIFTTNNRKCEVLKIELGIILIWSYSIL